MNTRNLSPGPAAGRVRGLTLALVLVGLTGVAVASPWARLKTSTPGPTQVIGKVSLGCIGGAQALAETGTGYVSIRRKRNRYYAHPATLELVQRLGQAMHERRPDRLIMIGDLSQPRGGRMDSMHRSHQNGVDVDVWLTLTPSAKDAKKLAPEGNDPPSMLQKDKRLVSKHWGEDQIFLLKTAAQDPAVARIFVNPGIKLALCASQGVEAEWLRKLRPWWGHDAHFHVRLNCPKDSPQCESQPPIGKGSGCGIELASWFKPKPVVKPAQKPEKQAAKKPVKIAKPRPPAIHPRCKPVLAYQKTEDRRQRADN
ncbi:MAG: penicillin-insensitive murein endopeptidase [Gammaproteobacteria bacterium SHHR-1]